MVSVSVKNGPYGYITVDITRAVDNGMGEITCYYSNGTCNLTDVKAEDQYKVMAIVTKSPYAQMVASNAGNLATSTGQQVAATTVADPWQAYVGWGTNVRRIDYRKPEYVIKFPNSTNTSTHYWVEGHGILDANGEWTTVDGSYTTRTSLPAGTTIGGVVVGGALNPQSNFPAAPAPSNVGQASTQGSGTTTTAAEMMQTAAKLLGTSFYVGQQTGNTISPSVLEAANLLQRGLDNSGSTTGTSNPVTGGNAITAFANQVNDTLAAFRDQAADMLKSAADQAANATRLAAYLGGSAMGSGAAGAVSAFGSGLVNPPTTGTKTPAPQQTNWLLPAALVAGAAAIGTVIFVVSKKNDNHNRRDYYGRY